ncbi:MAG: HAMP domain-containing histidine kinase [Flammeovirgaceae bacterium]|nr:HAMP domain-containing histidine kinase [Flammeovirgaceae bacterium]
MTSWIQRLVQSGVRDVQPPSLNRNLVTANIISLIIAGLALIMAALLWFFYNQPLFCLMVVCVSFLFFIPIIFNAFERIHISRFITSVQIPLYTIGISIITKSLYFDKVNPSNYFDGRFIITASVILPLIIIHIKELKLLVSAVSVSLLCLLTFDPLHTFFNVGFYELGMVSWDYPFAANFYPLLTYVFILASFLFMKVSNEKFEKENEALIVKLKGQNDEILAQSEELVTNQDQLMEAYRVIELQKDQLLGANTNLASEVSQSKQALEYANEELIKHNNELRQFSYTISHNLRAPVARLLGLTYLLKNNSNGLTSDQLNMIDLLNISSSELDTIIRDLNKIIDIRNEVYKIKEKVFFEAEWEQVRRSLASLTTSEMKIHADFSEAPFVYTIRPILNSVLYNLASNAIKYRSPKRPLEITLKSIKTTGYVKLMVSDNGLGINMDLYGKDLFGIYKRFHSDTEGKGLGLYLVKTQVESTGGVVSVESSMNVGTTFIIDFKTPGDIEGQIYFDSEFGSVYYNARTNTAGIVWKKQVDSEHYRTLFNKCVDMLRIYNTPLWLSDMRKQGAVSIEDQQWMVQNVLIEAVRNGLRRIAGIYDPHQHNDEYRNRISMMGQKLGVDIDFFRSRKEAEEWIEKYINPVDGVVKK